MQLPSELPKLIDPERDVEDYRKLFCEYYDCCLDEVVSRGWTSWTCARCPLFSHAPRARAAEACDAVAQDFARLV